jgi:hypothetical protein
MANLKTMRILPLFMILTIAGCAKENKTNCNYIKDYYQTIYLADYEFETEHYEKAFELYQDAFNSCEAKNTPTYNEIDKFTESAAILKKFDIAYEYAKKQVLKGVELTNFQNNASLDEFMTSKYGEKLVDEYEGLRKEFMKNAHLKLRDELIAMRTADQMHRGGYGKPDWPKQDSIDKLHEKRLIEIFESVGYPTDELVGPRTMENQVDVQLLLLHTKDSIRMNYFVPKVKEFVKNGKASPRTLGTMIDQYYLYNGEPQIYGTYNAQGGGYATIIDDLKKVDSNRISIGLPPLKLKEKKDSLNQIN